MAQIDLKFATINLTDGYGGSAAVNQPTTAPAAGDTTPTIQGLTGAVSDGDTFTVAGDTSGTPAAPVVHTITAHTETAGNTTSITFTPPLAKTVVNSAVVTLLPHTLTLFIGDG